VTHTVSAALIAAVVYAWVLVVGVDTMFVPTESPAVATVLLTVTTGIVWELLEQAVRLLSERFGIERVLKQYGKFDTPLDIVFDGIGAILVVGADLRLFVPLFEPVPGFAQHLFYGWMLGLAFGLLVSTMIIGSDRAIS